MSMGLGDFPTFDRRQNSIVRLLESDKFGAFTTNRPQCWEGDYYLPQCPLKPYRRRLSVGVGSLRAATHHGDARRRSRTQVALPAKSESTMTPFDLLLEPWRVYLLLLVIFVSIFAARRTHPVVTILVLTRYSWAMMVVQFAIGLIALVGFPLIGPSLFKNLFVLSEPLQIGAITCVSLVLATTALVTFRTTKLSAVNRFRDYDVALHDDAGAKTQAGWKRRLYQTLQSGPEQRDDWHKRWLLLIVIAFPLVVAAASDTYSDFAQVNRNTPAVLGGLVGGFIAGVACWGLLVAAATIFQQIFLQATVTDKGLFPFDRWQLVPRGLRLRWFDWLMRALARRVACFGPGYAVEDGLGNWRLQPG